ncbi:MAG TPA: Dam family site-specific DNA-(adenine-N6)-methyltransferase, partial [Candidatus Limnocylindrales bacterium]|nr:Dam family site-specific DNA-(adenine-N6)-methyltransferase [Candidatus Limnocylindrales bacterium]
MASSRETLSALPGPPLKWAGGKRWLAPRLVPVWGAFGGRRLVEPFCGGLAVALSLNPRAALLNDVNSHLINFYRQLQAGLVISAELANDSDLYYRHRSRFNDLIAEGRADTAEAAGLFYYLNRTGYNGLCRFNRSGGFNVPFGRYKTINYLYDFRAYVPALARWQFTCGDFADLALHADDFVYADPPYDVEFTSYSKEGFRWADQVRLAEWLTGHRGPVVISNQATPRIIDLYARLGFAVRQLAAPRRISSSGDRTPAIEMLAFLNVPPGVI